MATAGSTPVDYLGKKFGYVVLARAYDLFSYPNTGLVASVKKIKENPDQLKRVIKAGIKANRYLLQNREGTIQVMMQWMRIDKDTATATYDGSVKSFNDDGSVSEAGLRIAIDEAKQSGQYQPRGCHQRSRGFFDSARSAAGTRHEMNLDNESRVFVKKR